MKVRIIGFLQHAVQNGLWLYKMTQEQKTGESHIREVIHHVVTELRKKGRLPHRTSLQFDKFNRESNNWLHFSYLATHFQLCLFSAFGLLETSYNDTYQSFSTTSTPLPSRDAVMLSGLHYELWNWYNSYTVVDQLETLANLTKLWEIDA